MPSTRQTPGAIAHALSVLRDAGFAVVGPVRYLTVADAAGALAVSGTTIRKWVREGRFPGASMLPGGDLRIPASDLEAIAQAGRLAGPTRRPLLRGVEEEAAA